jgi:DNA-binding transcriptional MerR regulator
VDTISSHQLAAAAGVTYRRVFTWTTLGILAPVVPPRGSGTRTRFDRHEVLVARCVAQLSDLGATATDLRAVAATVRAWPADTWTGHLAVRPGEAPRLVLFALGDELLAHGAWVLDLRAIADEPVEVPHQLMLAG